MAKFTIPALLAALGSFSLQASAQDYNTSAPFVLQLSSDNDTISGQVLGACHSGAAIEQLCLAGNDTTPASYNTFYLNVSANANVPEGQYETGMLVWILQGSGFNLSEPLTFTARTLDTNVVSPQFQPVNQGSLLGFDDEDKLFMYSGNYDDTTFVPYESPMPITPKPLYRVSLLFPSFLPWFGQSVIRTSNY